MVSRKMEIKYIENTTRRKQTYSKRRKGILKKADELTILCNGQVCLIMFSKSGKIAEYVSPSTTMEEFLDRYQKKTKIDLSSEYEAANVNLVETLENELRKQKEINSTLRKEIGQRIGQEDLSEFSYGQLLVLKVDLRHSLEIVRHDKIRLKEANRCRVSYLHGSHLNPLNEVPSPVTLQLQPSQDNLHHIAGVKYFNFFQ
ncbi:hypothetical protein MKX03_035550 [Papaver bracteatum]|nr:hypothetical protein MKX03_035550 [Papaver bracteatum]